MTNIHTIKINKHTSVKVSLKIRIWYKRVFVSGCTRTITTSCLDIIIICFWWHTSMSTCY